MITKEDKDTKVYTFIEITPFKQCCHDELGRVLGFINMNTDGFFEIILSAGGNAGVYLTQEQAKTAFLNLLT